MKMILKNQKKIILTHSLELIKLIKYQSPGDINLYFFNNTSNENNGFIQVNKKEQEVLLNTSQIVKLLKKDIFKEIVNQRFFLISILSFMRGYSELLGKDDYKNELTKLMHHSSKKRISLSKIYTELFLEGIEDYFSNEIEINTDEILEIDINSIQILKRATEYKILDRVLRYNLIYLFLRIKSEKVLIEKYIKKNFKSNLMFGEIVLKSFPQHLDDQTEENRENRIFFLSRKTLINEFNHYENDLNIFQPAIDISDSALLKEKKEILLKLKKL